MTNSKNEIERNLATVFAGLNYDVKDIDGNSADIINLILRELPENSIENVTTTKIDLDKKEIFVGMFVSMEVVTDKKDESKQYCLVKFVNIKNKSAIMTFNIIMKKSFDECMSGDVLCIICTDKGANEKGEFSKYRIVKIDETLFSGVLLKQGVEKLQLPAHKEEAPAF